MRELEKYIYENNNIYKLKKMMFVILLRSLNITV